MPMAPPEIKVVLHVKPSQMKFYDLNGERAIVGPALEQYRCMKGFFLKMQSTRVCDTVTFYQGNILFL